MCACLGVVESNAREVDFGEFCLYLLFVADENDFANAFVRKNFCSLGSTNVIAFRKCNGFAEFACSAHKIFNKICHIKLLKCRN